MTNVYETAMRKLGVFHAPNYNPFARANDGVMHGIPRILFHTMWGVWAAPIVWATRGSAGVWAWLPLALALGFLLSIKLNNVLKGVYRLDPIDYVCDIGCGGGLGALLASHFVVGTPLALWHFALLAILYLVSFPWATP